MARNMFRQQALERLSSPEQLDKTLKVTSPGSWLVLSALGLVVAGVIVWGFVGSVPETTMAQGVVIHQGGVGPIVATQAGIVEKRLVQPGAVIKQGQPIFQLKQKTGEQQAPVILSSTFGQVIELSAEEGDLVQVGQTIGTIENSHLPLEVSMFVPFASAKKVKPGQEVNITLTSAEKEKYGLLKGKIKTISDFPVSSSALKSLLTTDTLVNSVTASGPTALVTVELVKDKETISGYKWTTKEGPPFKIDSGTLVFGEIVLKDQKPIELIFPRSIDREKIKKEQESK